MATLNLQVSASGDDVTTSTGSTTFFDTAENLSIGGVLDGSVFESAYRFTGVSGLAGATINSATLRLHGSSTGNGGSPLTLISAEDAASPGQITSASDFNGRTRTTANVAWDSALTADADNDSPDITAIIQELADSYDPSTIIILHDDNGSSTGAVNRQRCVSWDGTPANAPQLLIDYTPATEEINPTGIPSEEAFGTPSITVEPVISPTGIPSAEAFGTASVTVEPLISPSGIPSAEAFGTPSITVEPEPEISPVGIPSAEAFGTPSITIVPPPSPITTSLDQEPVYQFRARRFDTLATVGLITDFQSLRYKRRLHSLGEFQASILMTPDLLNWADNEGVLEIIRNDETVFVGICDIFNSDDDYDPGTNEGTVRGIDARAVLGWRDIHPAAGSEADEQDGVAAQNAIRHYVQNNLTAPTDTDRDIDGELTGVSFLIGSGALGSNVSRSERYSNLLDVAFAIAQAGDIWFEVTLTAGGDYELTFNTFNDKTVGEADQVLFATRQGTALSLPYNVSRRGYTNAVTVLGERIDIHQTRLTIEDLNNGSKHRRERPITGGGVRTSATLTIDDVTQFWTDWSDEPTFTGVVTDMPENWSNRWDDSNPIGQIQTTSLPSGTTGGAALRISDRTGDGSGPYLLASDFLGPLENREVEVVARMQLEHNEAYLLALWLVLHASADSGEININGYRTEMENPAGAGWALERIDDGVPSVLFTDSTPAFNVDTWYVHRVGTTLDNIRAKVWTGSEPGAWDTEIEDRTRRGGWIGVGRQSPSDPTNGDTWCDWIGVGLDGAAAPTSMPAQTVDIGAETYTFTWDMSVANNILPSLDGEVMVERLAAAINGEAGEGTIYGTGTTAHGDVVAVANGHNLRILATGATTADIDLSTALHNGSWDFDVIRLASLVELANGVLAEGAERIRSYEVTPNPATVPFRAAIDIGDIVTVRNGDLDVEDDKLIRAVKVQFSQTGGERFTLELGELPLTLIDIIQQNRQDTDRIGRR